MFYIYSFELQLNISHTIYSFNPSRTWGDGFRPVSGSWPRRMGRPAAIAPSSTSLLEDVATPVLLGRASGGAGLGATDCACQGF